MISLARLFAALRLALNMLCSEYEALDKQIARKSAFDPDQVLFPHRTSYSYKGEKYVLTYETWLHDSKMVWAAHKKVAKTLTPKFKIPRMTSD